MNAPPLRVRAAEVRTVVAYPGNMAHAQHVALSMLEVGCLEAFVTSFAWRQGGTIDSLLSRLPSNSAQLFIGEIRRRSIDQIPAHVVHSYPFWEVVRSAAMRLGFGDILVDTAWDIMAHKFDAVVAQRYVPNVEAVQAFEYTALAAFERANELGVARVLHLPSLDSRRFEEIQRREKAQWPDLLGEHDAYFNTKFKSRYARRCREIALADVVIANSSLTAQSHIDAGANPAKVFVVPLGAPQPVSSAYTRPRGTSGPLKVIYAGTFSLRKGAHHLLAGWKLLSAGKSAQLEVFGRQMLPKRLQADEIEGIAFRGSVPQRQLFEAFEAADVLVFPTLSDGFGMVVLEAMAHGLPVITTDQAGAADLVTPGNGLVVPAADPSALALALQWCLDNRCRLIEMRTHALDAARRRQWSDFRRDLILALNTGLQRAGYSQTREQAMS